MGGPWENYQATGPAASSVSDDDDEIPVMGNQDAQRAPAAGVGPWTQYQSAPDQGVGLPQGLGARSAGNPGSDGNKTAPPAELPDLGVSRWDDSFRKAGAAYGMNPGLLKSIAKQESGFDPDAIGPDTQYGNASGLMQLLPSTGKWLGVTDWTNPDQQIWGAARYMAYLKQKFGTDAAALVAYNWGEGKLKNWLSDKPDLGAVPPETRDYVKAVYQNAGLPREDITPFVGEPTPMSDAVKAAGAYGKNVALSLAGGAAQGLGAGLKGTAALSTDQPYLAPYYDTYAGFGSMTPDQQQMVYDVIGDDQTMPPSARAALVSKLQDAAAGKPVLPVDQFAGPAPDRLPAARAGAWLQDQTKAHLSPDAGFEKSLSGRVSSNIGAIGPGMAAAVAGGPLLGAAYFGAQTAGDEGDLAQSQGASPDQAATAARYGQTLGTAAGLVNVEAVLAPVRNLGPGAVKWAATKLAQAGRSGVTFAGVGEAQEWLADQFRRDYNPDAQYSFDPDRLQTSLLSGAILGAAHPAAKAADARSSDPATEAPTAAAGSPAPEGGPFTAGFDMGSHAYVVRDAQGNAVHSFPDADAAQAHADRLNADAGQDASFGTAAEEAQRALPGPAQLQGLTFSPDRSRGEGFTVGPNYDAAPWADLLPPGQTPAALPAPEGVAYGEGFSMRPSEPDQESASLPALPAPATTAGPGFSMGEDPAAVARGQEIQTLQATIARRQKEMGALQRQIARQTDPAERQRLTGLFKTKSQQVDAANARINDLTPSAPQVDVQEAGTAQPPPLQGQPGGDGAQGSSAPVRSGDPVQAVHDAAQNGLQEAAALSSPAQDEHAATPIEQAAAQVNTTPTDPQKAAGNYQKGHVRLHGLDISIENPRGSERSGTDPATGDPWSVTLPDHYGYIKKTEGADGDHVDAYIGPDPTSRKAFVIDQVDAANKGWDEHKVMLGYPDAESARAAYQAAFSDGRGPDRVGGLTETSVDGLKDWLKTGDTTKPFADQVVPISATLREGEHPLRGADRIEDRMDASHSSLVLKGDLGPHPDFKVNSDDGSRTGKEEAGSEPPPSSGTAEAGLRREGSPQEGPHPESPSGAEGRRSSAERSAGLTPPTLKKIPFIKTAEMREGLRARGLSDEQVDATSPVQAIRMLGLRGYRGADGREVGADSEGYPHEDPAAFQREAKERDSSIEEFANSALKNRGSVQRKEVGDLSPEWIDRVRDQTGVDLSGYRHVWTSYGILHALKEHGNPRKELPRGQIPISPKDFPVALNAVENFDSVHLLPGRNKNGNRVLEFRKRLNGTWVVSEEEMSGRKFLALSSLRISKSAEEKSGTDDAHLSPDVPTRNVRSDTGAEDNIPLQGSDDNQHERSLSLTPSDLGDMSGWGTRDIGDGAKIHVDPATQADRTRAQMRLNGLVGKIAGADRVRVRVVDAIETPDGSQALGTFIKRANTIFLTHRDIDAMAGSARHEAVHFLRSAGALVGRNWEVLSEAARRDWRQRYNIDETYAQDVADWRDRGLPDEWIDDRLNEEAVAFAASDYAAGNLRAAGIVARGLQMIRRVIEACRNLVAGRGASTAEGILSDIDAGKMAGRGRREEMARETAAAFERAPAPTDATEETPTRRGPAAEIIAAARKVAEAPSVQPAKEFMGRVLEDLQRFAAPMALRSGSDRARAVAKDFANGTRQAHWQAGRFDDFLKKTFTPEQRTAMWNAMDEASVAAQRAREGGADASGAERAGQAVLRQRLNTNQRLVIEEMSRHASGLWQKAVDAGMVKGEGLPFWTPRMGVMIGEDGTFGHLQGDGEGAPSLDSMGRNLTSNSPNLKGRKHLTADETEQAMKAKFGPTAKLVRDVRTMPLAMERLERAISGRVLMNQIGEIGRRVGTETVADGEKPGFFTLDHPALKTFVPRTEEITVSQGQIERRGLVVRDGKVFGGNSGEELTSYHVNPDGTIGQMVWAKDDSGNTIYDRVPLYISKEFEGPLRAVLTSKPSAAYNALMAIKGKSMGLIMYSPLIHNAVEWGRALPVMPGKVATFRIYGDGKRALADQETMKEAIAAGLAPIGHRGQWNDITSIAEEPNLAPGRSWTAQGIGAVVDRVGGKELGDRVRSAVDAAGDFWHNTLLWNQVAKLQAGLYTNVRDSLLAKGMPREAATKVSAHFANRYAGSLPAEAMGEQARQLANLAMFSRTFTTGNLGVMKDMITGLPKDVQAQLRREIGDKGTDAAVSVARRKAIAAFALDIGMMLGVNALLQTGANLMMGQSMDDQERALTRRMHRMVHAIQENPWHLLNPLFIPDSLSPTADNEPGKGRRIMVGHQADGTAIYARIPTGKVSEDFVDWLTSPLEMMKRKASTFVRPIADIATNDAGFGPGHRQVPVYDPNGSIPKMVGQIAWHFLKAQEPDDVLQYLKDTVTGEKVTDTDTLKAVGPLAGITFSKGAPGGEAIGEYYAAKGRHDVEVQQALPEINKKLRGGKRDEAVAQMRALGMDQAEINARIKSQTAPSAKFTPDRMKKFQRFANPEERDRMDDRLSGRN